MTASPCKCCDGTGVQLVDAFRTTAVVGQHESTLIYHGVRVLCPACHGTGADQNWRDGAAVSRLAN